MRKKSARGLKKLAGLYGLAWLAATALGGCGGGESQAQAQAQAPAAAVVEIQSMPLSAGASVSALMDYQQGLAVSHRGEPMALSTLVLPTSNTAEPIPLN